MVNNVIEPIPGDIWYCSINGSITLGMYEVHDVTTNTVELEVYQDPKEYRWKRRFRYEKSTVKFVELVQLP